MNQYMKKTFREFVKCVETIADEIDFDYEYFKELVEKVIHDDTIQPKNKIGNEYNSIRNFLIGLYHEVKKCRCKNEELEITKSKKFYENRSEIKKIASQLINNFNHILCNSRDNY